MSRTARLVGIAGCLSLLVLLLGGCPRCPPLRSLPIHDDPTTTEDGVPMAPAHRETFSADVGIVRDRSRGIVWTASATARPLAWRKAYAYCASLDRHGRSDWRLPTVEELTGLWSAEAPEVSCGDHICRIPPFFTIGSRWVWSGTPSRDDRRTYVDLEHGTRFAPIIRSRLARHVLCVATDRDR